MATHHEVFDRSNTLRDRAGAGDVPHNANSAGPVEDRWPAGPLEIARCMAHEVVEE